MLDAGAVAGVKAGAVVALMFQGARGEPNPTPCLPAHISAFAGLFSRGLGLPTDSVA